MRIYIPQALKSKIRERAKHRCEYCHMPEFISYFTFHIEHIRPLKHGGKTVLENLALSCPDCNYHKGTDIGTYLEKEDHIVRFFNPRKDNWNEHLSLENDCIVGISPIGFATEKIFKFNIPERLNFRKELIALGLY